jgi:hypothetical protein
MPTDDFEGRFAPPQEFGDALEPHAAFCELERTEPAIARPSLAQLHELGAEHRLTPQEGRAGDRTVSTAGLGRSLRALDVF